MEAIASRLEAIATRSKKLLVADNTTYHRCSRHGCTARQRKRKRIATVAKVPGHAHPSLSDPQATSRCLGIALAGVGNVGDVESGISVLKTENVFLF